VVAEVHAIQSQPSPLVAAQARRAERLADSEKFEKLIENLNVSCVCVWCVCMCVSKSVAFLQCVHVRGSRSVLPHSFAAFGVCVQIRSDQDQASCRERRRQASSMKRHTHTHTHTHA